MEEDWRGNDICRTDSIYSTPGNYAANIFASAANHCSYVLSGANSCRTANQ